MLIINEEDRLKELYSYNILDTISEEQFDSIVEIASYICQAPISLVSLVDKDRQWFKAKVGIDVQETERKMAFCNHAIMQENIFEIEDACKDERFKNNPLVISEPNIRFYAGQPLITKNGYALGTLCVIDTKPKKLSKEQRKALINLAKQVVFNIESRKNFLELRKKQEDYLSIFEKTSDLIHIIDPNGKILKVNNSWKKLLEYSDEEIENLNLFDVIHPESFEHCIDLFTCIKSGKTDCSDRVIYTMKSKNGKRIIVEGSVIVERFDNNELKLIKSILRDITHRIELENELKVKEKKFRDIYDLSPVGIALNDLKTGNFIEVNQALCNSTGYSKEEILNISYWDLTPRYYEEDEKKQLELLNTIGRYGPYQKEYIKKNGIKFPVLLNGVKFIDENNKELILSVIQDITDIKKYEKELELAKEEALKNSEFKSIFLANMSHEIRTPLNSIIGFSDLLIKTELTNEQKQYMNNIYQSANFLLDLVNDILDFSKIEAGKIELFYSDINLLEWLRNIISVIRFNAHKKGIELIVEYPKNIFKNFYIDDLRLKQVITNLLSNSVKFTEKGEVKLKLEILEELENNYKKIKISVSDTGIGISKENIEKIFNPFEQENYYTQKNYGGTGLGLSISKKLLNLMNSDLKVISEFGVGSTFYFEIVVKTSGNVENKILNIDDKILVISNYLSNLNWFKTIFNDLNISADFYTDYKNINNNYDLVFIDNNFENIEYILEKFKTSKIVMLNNSCQEILKKENIIKTIVKPVFRDDIINIFDNTKDLLLEDKKNISIETNNLNILVAEDNKVNMLLIKTYFKNIFPKINLITAENGIEAFEIYKNNKIDLILTDIQMPEMNGYELAKEIRKLNNNIPIIALTASSTSEEKNKSIKVGINDFITKPITQNSFKEVMSKWIGSKL